METTRHFCVTVYVVREGAVLLHHHDRADQLLPPGGHIDRDELPRSAAHREVREETGRGVTLRSPETEIDTPRVSERPPPERILLVDVHHYDDETVGHQHLDLVYYGRLEPGPLEPEDEDLTGADWEQFRPADLDDDRLAPDVREQARDALATLADSSDG